MLLLFRLSDEKFLINLCLNKPAIYVSASKIALRWFFYESTTFFFFNYYFIWRQKILQKLLDFFYRPQTKFGAR